MIYVIHANGYISEWKWEQDATRAAWLYKSELLSKFETRKAVVQQMDLQESIMDQGNITCYIILTVTMAMFTLP